MAAVPSELKSHPVKNNKKCVRKKNYGGENMWEENRRNKREKGRQNKNKKRNKEVENKEQ
jgi:hypothetical protein